MNPLTVLACNDTLCTKDDTIFFLIGKSFKSGLYLVGSVASCSFSAPACEYLISMVVVMMLMIVVMVVTTAGAVLVMLMVMMMLVFIMIVMMVVFMLLMIVVMFMFIVVMIVTAAGAVLVMFMVVMMLVFILIVVVMVVMLVLIIMVMMVMIVLCSFLQKLLEFIVKGILLCHCINKLLTCKLVPVGSYDRCGRILFTQALYAVIQLFLRKSLYG